MTIKHWFLIIKTKFCVYMNLMYYPPGCLGFEHDAWDWPDLVGCHCGDDIKTFYLNSFRIITGQTFGHGIAGHSLATIA